MLSKAPISIFTNKTKLEITNIILKNKKILSENKNFTEPMTYWLSLYAKYSTSNNKAKIMFIQNHFTHDNNLISLQDRIALKQQS